MSETPKRWFGIQNRQRWTWEEQKRNWSWFEELGFDSLWITDHLTPTSGPMYNYFEAWTLLGALAVTTSKARIGVLVSSNTFRHPGVLAKQAVTIDHISGGRLEFGLGTGWYLPEHEQFGLDFPPTKELVDRFAEAVEMIDRFFRGDLVDFDGTYYQMKGAPNRPKPVQQPRPPFVFGAQKPRMLALTAKYADTWNARGTPEEVAPLNQQLNEACAKIGRNPDEIKRSFLYGPSITPIDNPWQSPDAFADFVGRYTEAGIREFLMQPPETEDFPMVEKIANDLIPALRTSL